MSNPCQDRLPGFITAGDTLIFNAVFSDYPITAGWALTYSGIKDGGGTGNTFTFTSSTPDPTGQGFAFSVAPIVTSAWNPGKYWVQGQVSLSTGETHTVTSVRFEVKADITQSGTADLRSHASITLDNIKAVIENRATQSIADSVVNGVQLRKMPIADLIVLYDKFTELVRSEDDALRIASGQGTRRKILTRFGCSGGVGSENWSYKSWLQ